MISSSSLETIGKITGVAVFLFTIYSYVNNLKVEQDRKQYEVSIGFIKEYSTSIRRIEQELEMKLLYYKDINNIKFFPDKKFKLIAEEILFDFVPNRNSSEQNKTPFLDDILNVSDFYDRSFFCIDQNICNDKITGGFLCSRALLFYKKNKRLIRFYTNLSTPSNVNHEFSALRNLCKKETNFVN
jgi:hypothetical protein